MTTLNMTTSKINYLAIFVAAIATFILGAIWYITFNSAWMELSGVTEEMALKGGVNAYLISFVTYLLSAYAMALILKAMNVGTLQTGALTGALIGAFIVGSNIFTNNAYELKPIGLSVLNAGFSAVSFVVMGGILGAWQKK
jgi:surface polysaccharide O-acyltransferase-like enzyme